MDIDEYRKMDEAESQMWWYFGLHANLIAALEATDDQRRPTTLLDAGCGTGGFLTSVAARASGISLFGLDFEPIAASFAARKSGADVRVGSINNLPYEAATFDVIVSADVLCHRSVDERLAISEFHRCLKPGGRLLLNLPAYNWMMSAHDVAVHTSRRFTAGGIKKSLAGGGFRHITAGYWNTFLFPMMIERTRLRGRGA